MPKAADFLVHVVVDLVLGSASWIALRLFGVASGTAIAYQVSSWMFNWGVSSMVANKEKYIPRLAAVTVASGVVYSLRRLRFIDTPSSILWRFGLPVWTIPIWLAIVIIFLPPCFILGMVVIGKGLNLTCIAFYLVGRYMLELIAILIVQSAIIKALWEAYLDASPYAKRRDRKRQSDRFSIVNNRFISPLQNHDIGFVLQSFLVTIVMTLPVQLLVHLPYIVLRQYPVLIKLGIWIGGLGLIVVAYASGMISMLFRLGYTGPVKKSLVSLGFPSRSPALPMEIWVRIIEIVIDAPEYLETSCAPDDLPYFVFYHRHRTITKRCWGDPYRISELRRRSLRLVSHNWKTVADQYANRRVGTSISQLGKIEVSSIVRMDVEALGQVEPYSYNNPVSRSQLLTTSEVRKLGILTIRASSTDLMQNRDSVINLTNLVGHAPLRCFSCEAFRLSLTPSFVEKISTSFSILQVLILETQVIQGNVEFPHLYTLDLLAPQIDLSGWKCPKLRNLVLSSQESYPSHLPLRQLSNLVPLHFHNLEALIGKGMLAYLDAKFWSRYPRLHLLGCHVLQLVTRPPTDHPLKHLLISNEDVFSSSPQNLLTTLESINGAKTLYLPPYKNQYPYPQRSQWSELYVKCERDGIKWKTIDPEQNRTNPWEILLPIGVANKFEEIMFQFDMEIGIALALALHSFAYSFFNYTRDFPFFVIEYAAEFVACFVVFYYIRGVVYYT